MLNLFGPPLLAEFGWSKAQFAMVGSLGLLGMLAMPFAGRFADRHGTRVSAIVGFCAVPACYLWLSMMTGNLYEFFAIIVISQVFGILTTTFVFTRVVVERFDRARGLAMACMLSAPPLIGAVAVQVIGGVIEAEGWRMGYRVLAALSALGGLAAILLVGRDAPRPPPTKAGERMDWAKLREMAGNRVFVLLLGGMFFCNLPQVLVSSQMNIMLMDNGASAAFATSLVSLYAICVVIGRFASGFALDRVAPHRVAIVSLGLPAVGYLALASGFDARWVLAGSIALVGLAQGAETDVGAILTSRKFAMRHYSFIFSLLMASMGLASAIGSAMLGAVLQRTDSFDPFLILCAASTLVGAACFFLTGRFDRTEDAPHPAPANPGEA